MSVFLNEINNKNLFCYGAGKVFEDFLNSHPDIKIVAVIDKNYRNGCIEVGNQRIPVISVETFLKEADNAILLITCFDYSEVEKDGVKSRTLRVNEARIFNMSERALLTEATFDRSLSLEEAVTSTLAQNKETVLEARMKKGEKMISEYQSISGTVKDPYKWKNYECAEIDGNYCIRDLETNGMIRFSFDSKEKKFLANYFPQTGADFVSEGKGKEVLSIVSTGTGQRADLHAHNNAYKILSTPMAEKFFEN